MELSREDRAVLAALEGGLPLVSEPYAHCAREAGLSQPAFLARLRSLLERGVIKRHGLIVRHRALGYRANGMVVWDIPDADVAAVGTRLAREPAVTLCYQRPRRPPRWPYNLFCMIHGRERAQVEAEVEAIAARHQLSAVPRAILFSSECYKQRGAHYFSNGAQAPGDAREAG